MAEYENAETGLQVEEQETAENAETGWKWEIKRNPKGGRNVFWGIVLVLGASAMLLNKLGYLSLGGIGFWPAVFSVCLAAVVIDGLIKRSFGEMVFALAFLVIVNDELLHLEAITPWPVLLAACAITVGLNMLFPKFRRNHFVCIKRNSGKSVTSESREGDAVSYENSFGGTVKYITGEVAAVAMDNSFGAMEVYFSDAILKNGTAIVHVESAFGGVVLYVPSDWRVVINVDTTFGSAEEKGRCNPNGEDTLYVDGDISFGALEVKYI